MSNTGHQKHTPQKNKYMNLKIINTKKTFVPQRTPSRK